MLPYKYEGIRKVIHLSNLIIPFFLFYYDKFFVIKIIIPITIIFISFDYLRIINSKVSDFYNKYFFLITRDFETSHFTGASYVLFSSSLIITVFSKDIAIVSLLIMSISDSLAALIGRKYGSIKFFKKTLEGSMAFLLSSIFIILSFSKISVYPAMISALITTLVESSKFLNIDDNLTVPLSFAAFYSFLIYFFNKTILMG